MRTLISNLHWKLLALASSVALWYLFAGEAELASSVPVVVQYRNVPADLEISSEHIDRIFLKLRGPVARLKPAELAQTAIMLDLANVQRPGEHTFTLGQDNLRLPSGVMVVRVVPSQIRLTFDRRGSRYLPVEPRYSGPPAKGYRIVAQTVLPQSVRVVGPESRLVRLDSVSTDPIDLNAVVGSAEFRVSAFLSDPQLRFEPHAQQVAVRVTLEKIP